MYPQRVRLTDERAGRHTFSYLTRRGKPVTFSIDIDPQGTKWCITMRMNKRDRTFETLSVMHQVSTLLTHRLNEHRLYRLKELIHHRSIRYAPKILSLSTTRQ